MVTKKRMTMIGGLAAAAALAAAGGLAAAGIDDGDDQPLTGETYTKAVAAALAHTGGGTVTETAIGDDGAAYEVEVRKDDGGQVEVQLDREFRVIGSEADDDGDSNADDK